MKSWICPTCGPLDTSQYREYTYKTGRVRRCISCSKSKRAVFYTKNANRENQVAKSQRESIKLEVIIAYSPELKCTLCSEKRVEFLVVDHIHGGGNKHRDKVGQGSFYRWLKEAGFPIGFRILCHNCNWKHGVRTQPPRVFQKSNNLETIRKQAYRIKYPDKYENYKATLRSEIKLRRERVIHHYGSTCECCETSDMDVLSLDHMDGGGTQHRKEVGSGTTFFKWIEESGYPKEFRVLCLNCNVTRGLYGTCPHERERIRS